MLVTIITAVRCDTQEKQGWFTECATSVLKQTHQEWKWVVVDDASPFPPEAPNDPRIRLIRSEKHRGVARCRNLAVRLAETEAILPLDGDDLLVPDAISQLVLLWDPKRLVYGDVQVLENDQPGQVIHFPPYSFDGVLKFVTGPVVALHSKECWKAAGGWKAKYREGLEDVEYWIAAGAKGYCGVKLDTVILYYRRHPESRTKRMRRAFLQKTQEDLIRADHADLYTWHRPPGCCGGGMPSRKTRPSPHRLGLPGPKVQMVYKGRRVDEFFVRGAISEYKYPVTGVGATFEVLVADVPGFLRLGRGKDFCLG